MAGAGFKTFNTGDVLTASDVNTYLMQQTVMVFASSAARSTALGANVAEGMFSYLKDTKNTEYYDGTAWIVLSTGGDITGVTAGTGITGGGTTGTVTVTNDMATAIDAKGDLIVGTGDNTYIRRAVGTNNQILMADSAQTDGVKWAASSTSTLTAKGDLLTATAANTLANIAVGTNGQVLSADSTTATGLKWITPATAASFVGVSVYKTAVQSANNTTNTIISFDAEQFDTDAFHDNTTNNSRLTIPSGQAGKYCIIGNITYASNSTGLRQGAIIKNGVDSLDFNFNAVNGAASTVVCQWILDLAVGDYVQLQAYQSSGGALNINSGFDKTVFQMIKVG